MIRKIEENDAAAAAELCRTALGHNTSEAVLRANIARLKYDSAYVILGAVEPYEVDGEKLRGILQAQRYDLVYGDSGYNIIALAVSEDCRGTGTGRQLVEALEAHAKENGASFIRLNSRVERTNAHAFYEHLGYTCDKTQKRFIRYLK